jgi:hypothetical protein
MPFFFLAPPADAAMSDLTWCSSSSSKDEDAIFYAMAKYENQ